MNRRSIESRAFRRLPIAADGLMWRIGLRERGYWLGNFLMRTERTPVWVLWIYRLLGPLLLAVQLGR